jgi:class 3 adenylate cyclase/predicted ATPase
MTFEEIVDQALAMLQRRGRVAYRTLKRQFNLDDDALQDLKAEIIKAQWLAVDEDGEVLVWTGGQAPAAEPAREQGRSPRSYTPAHLAEKILSSKAALEGERKQVTVLFADIKGSMELLADRDPEEARHLLDPVLERMMAAVHRYEGTVNQVMGDGIMALFGAPIAHEDHSVRACYAALAMQESIRHYRTEVRHSHGVELQVRVGLNSGEVVVRSIGNDLHMDYSAIGQTTHLAARMEQLATPGSIRLTAGTLRLVEGLVRVTALGPIPVKGLTEPVAVFELTGASGICWRLQAAVARGLTRFVGREPELEALMRARERAGAGHGQVVAAVGEAGVGKSRLVYEFVHSYRTQSWLVLEAASVSYGKATPYFPVVELLKRYMRVEDGDEPRTVRAKVTGHLLTLDEALQETVPALLALLFGLWRYYFVRSQLHTARELGDTLLRLAQRADDPALAVLAHHALGLTWFYLGALPVARQHLQAGIARCSPDQRRAPAFRMGSDLGVACRLYAAWTLWALGYPAQALARLHEALALAHELAHPFSLAAARVHAAYVSQFRRDVPAVHAHAEAAVALATAQGFAQWAAGGASLRGWALALQGQGEAGLAQVRQGIAAFRATGAALFVPYHCTLLADVADRLGHPEDGLQALAEAHTLVEQQEQRWWEAEVCRLRGILLLRQTGTPPAEAEAWLQRALDVARRQEAKSLELRAAMSLTRLWQQQGKRTEAYELLAPIYGWFTEGFDTADLQEAKALLEALR